MKIVREAFDFADYASAPGCGGMGAVDDRTITCFTNRGRAMDLLAPGSMVTTSRNGGGTMTGAGTSFAAPMAAGVAALLYQADPDLRPADVERILKNTGQPVEHPDNDDVFPLVDALAAVESVLPETPTPDATATPEPSSTPTAAPATNTPTPAPATPTRVIDPTEPAPSSAATARPMVPVAPTSRILIAAVWQARPARSRAGGPGPEATELRARPLDGRLAPAASAP